MPVSLGPAVAEAESAARELPAGLGDLLPEAAEALFALRRRLLGVLARWGYRPLVPPLIEYAEVFGRASADADEGRAVYRLVDRATGHVLALRPDFTPQVARIAAARFAREPLPLRFCYEGPVLRHVPVQRGRSRQLHQVGAECLGAPGPEADAEVIAAVIECLEAAGVSGFKLDLGQVEFFKGIVSGAELAPGEMAELRACVARKDLSDLTRLLERLRLPDAKKRLLAELPLLAGGVAVLTEAGALVESEASASALANLVRVVEFVSAEGLADRLTIDLGELRGIDYHTGVIFEAFVPHAGAPLARGGRYDRLMGLYGADMPATGFSLDLLGLMAALAHGAEPPEPEGVFLVAGEPRAEALGLAARLRAAGVRTGQELLARPLEESVACARSQGYRWVALLAGQGAAPPLLLDLSSGSEEPLTLDSIYRRLAAEE